MTPEELLGVTPALLAKSILHRRERLAEVIPEQLDARQEELLAAEPLARAAKEKRDGINTKVANLKKERAEAQTKARALFNRAGALRDQLQASGGIKDPDPKWAKEILDSKLQSLEQELETNAGNHKTEQKYIQEMKALIRQHDEWVAQRASSQEGLTEMDASFKEAKALLDTAQKAHDAILEFASENEYFHTTYVEHEAHRRRADGRTKRLAEALDSSQRGIEHWQKIIDDGFVRLLSNATKVQQGGASSSVRNRKPVKNDAPKRGKARRASTAKPKAGGEEE
ncbi:hypothetical protein OAO11_05075 [Candidatus Poseidoniaceae archaeon]|nr:hypothetical protein [Candidatus Poseidoniaceae archaeon]